VYGDLLMIALLWNVAPSQQLLAKHGIVLLNPVEERIVQKTNAERRRHGLPPLSVDGHLVRSARRHTAWMTRSRTLRHTSSAVGENIAMGQQSSHEAVRAWMSSSGHRANILSSQYSKIGVAAYTASDGTVYWCQQFLR
jgi:uncharacterized protein YkwD